MMIRKIMHADMILVNVCMQECENVHTYVPACITCMHRHTYMHACMLHTCMSACIHTCTAMSIHTNLHAYNMHAYNIHTYIHCMHAHKKDACTMSGMF